MVKLNAAEQRINGDEIQKMKKQQEVFFGIEFGWEVAINVDKHFANITYSDC